MVRQKKDCPEDSLTFCRKDDYFRLMTARTGTRSFLANIMVKRIRVKVSAGSIVSKVYRGESDLSRRSEVILEFSGPAWMAQTPQGFAFNLPDAFARQAKFATDLF